MRNKERGASTLAILGIIIAILGVVAIMIAPQIMNHAEIDTLRYVGGGMIALGAILALAASQKRG